MPLLSGSPSFTRLFRKYSPKEFILSCLFGLIRQKYNLFFNCAIRALGKILAPLVLCNGKKYD